VLDITQDIKMATWRANPIWNRLYKKICKRSWSGQLDRVKQLIIIILLFRKTELLIIIKWRGGRITSRYRSNSLSSDNIW